jgi:hypothetical protein
LTRWLVAALVGWLLLRRPARNAREVSPEVEAWMESGFPDAPRVVDVYDDLVDAYVRIWNELNRPEPTHPGAAATGFVRRHFHRRLGELHDALIRLAATLPATDPLVAWIEERRATIERLGATFESRSPLASLKTWTAVIGTVLALPFLGALGEWTAKALPKDQDALFVLISGGGLGSAGGIVFWALFFLHRGFHTKRDVLLGGADDGRWFRQRQREKHSGENVYGLEERLFRLIGLGVRRELQLDLAMWLALLYAISFAFWLAFFVVAAPGVATIPLGGTLAVTAAVTAVVGWRASKRKWTGRRATT